MKMRLVVIRNFLLLCLLGIPLGNCAHSGDEKLYPAQQTSSTSGGSIEGILIEQQTQKPLPGISVTVYTPGGVLREWKKTNELGAFTFDNIPPKDTYIWLSVKKHPIHNIPIAFSVKDANGKKLKLRLTKGQILHLGKINVKIMNDQIEAVINKTF